MNQPKFKFLIAAFFAVCLFSFNNAFAQTPSPKRPLEPSFDVVLQTVVASNNSAGKSAVSQPLAAVIKKLKNDFAFSDYRLTSTFMQRISNNGNIELKSVSYEENQNKSLPVFSEFVLSGFQSLADETGAETIQIQNFRFGQRVPVFSNGLTTYEQTGLSNRFSLPKNTPTVVGSLTTSRPDELMFLILTVSPSEK